MTAAARKKPPELISGEKSAMAVLKAATAEPSAEQLEKINRYALKPLKADEVYVRTCYLAHNGIDRDRECFDDALLDDFARSLPGKGFFRKHPSGWDGDSGPGVGRWFEAQTVTMSFDEARVALREPNLRFPPTVSMAKLLVSSFYMLRGERNDGFAADIDGGVAGDVSIGFAATDVVAVKDENQNNVCMRWVGPGEAREGSMVWLGAQPGARAFKSAPRNDNRTEVDVDKDEQIKAANKRADDAEAKVKELQAKVDAFDALVKAVGEDAVKNPAKMAQAIKDGTAYRSRLIDDIVQAERVAGLVKGDDEAAIKAARTPYEDRDVAWLEAWRERLTKEPKAPGVTGSEPSRPGPAPGGGLRDASVTTKAVKGGA